MQKYQIATKSQNSSMPTNVFNKETFSFCLSNEKIPYLKSIPHRIIKQEETQSIIEIEVDSQVLIDLVYAGVQYGMNKMSPLNEIA